MVLNPLVSVAIITYNQKEYLRECIESVLSQSYKNIEIIVANDCSTDGTIDLLNEYNINHPGKFKILNSVKNQGITKNSNLAHFACSGKYIAWIGGDDIMLPNKIYAQVKFMEKNKNCSICYHNLEVFFSNPNRPSYLLNNNTNTFEGDFKKVVTKGTFNGASSTMVRREMAPKDGYDERIPIASDWLYWMQTLGNGGEIRFINEVLGKYRRHENNVTIGMFKIDCLIDHLNSCNILILQYPQYSNAIFIRYNEILRSLRILNPENYKYWIKLSSIKPLNFKSVISYIFYNVSFGRLKL